MGSKQKSREITGNHLKGKEKSTVLTMRRSCSKVGYKESSPAKSYPKRQIAVSMINLVK